VCFSGVLQFLEEPFFRQLLGTAATAAYRNHGGNTGMVTVRAGDVGIDGFQSMDAAFFNQPIQRAIRSWRCPRSI